MQRVEVVGAPGGRGRRRRMLSQLSGCGVQ
jgi:hypothetical protein